MLCSAEFGASATAHTVEEPGGDRCRAEHLQMVAESPLGRVDRWWIKGGLAGLTVDGLRVLMVKGGLMG